MCHFSQHRASQLLLLVSQGVLCIHTGCKACSNLVVFQIARGVTARYLHSLSAPFLPPPYSPPSHTIRPRTTKSLLVVNIPTIILTLQGVQAIFIIFSSLNPDNKYNFGQGL